MAASKTQAFKKWFSSHDWWHENTAEETLSGIWTSLTQDYGMKPKEATKFLDQIISVMRNEYGE